MKRYERLRRNLNQNKMDVAIGILIGMVVMFMISVKMYLEIRRIGQDKVGCRKYRGIGQEIKVQKIQKDRLGS